MNLPLVFPQEESSDSLIAAGGHACLSEAFVFLLSAGTQLQQQGCLVVGPHLELEDASANNGQVVMKDID